MLDEKNSTKDESFSDLESQLSRFREKQRRESEDDDPNLTELAIEPTVELDTSKNEHLEDNLTQARRLSSTGSGDYHNEYLSELEIPDPSRQSHEAASQIGGNDFGATAREQDTQSQPEKRSAAATELFVLSYLIFFSLLGTLSRLGIEAITTYPLAPVSSPVLWANFGGSFIFGFLATERKLFKEEWGQHLSIWSFHNLETNPSDEKLQQQALQKHQKIKKTIPLFIGLSTGFCGSFTSFSSFMRDTFLAMSNQLILLPDQSQERRQAAYGFEALLAILIVHIACSLAALQLGGHFGLWADSYIPTLPFRILRRFIDPLMVAIGFISWTATVIMAIWPPETLWRGQVLFALVFAPVGCLFRFYVSKHLNGYLSSFPLGTFTANTFGTVVVGICFDLQHAGLRSGSSEILICQVLEGLIEGFSGCATTVSTWVGEMNSLETRHAFIYGGVTVLTGLGLLVAIMGTLLWKSGFEALACTT